MSGLDVDLGGAIGELARGDMRAKKGSLTERMHQLGQRRPRDSRE